ncbi:hypothetical protein PtrSN002B_009650 [Pyrenophora tritici-repentis]|uniref:Uncharacterized protein n=1 Tax=Pyrenophora tritici-repentis TaxID=45151 RepID=A0A2W1DWZ5_9PLEO|nr:hypothetical protein Alg130_10011 [Pyrenophora tritici-repentis]KAI1516410.1 hypothetical protein Ptr86124_004947 [Pyrenophora tritici-repentis]KAI1536349.1 hypothetical protein PtrSN002B_009650 [Pyrenophora tritici-repentis]KAI1671372.1 hypothetical protein L13192_04729 [Pyrenophora tritici-repentis]KAI1685189.1 hypothetical protein KJE20_05473 [Pyrenophora tritici-repentis]
MENTTLSREQQSDILNPPQQCHGCITKLQNLPEFPFAHPGPLYAIRGCNHYMCRSCLTAQYTQAGDVQTSCVCGNPADVLIVQDINPYLSPAYLLYIDLLEIFNVDSALFAGNTAISIDTAVALAVFDAIYTPTLETVALSLDNIPAEYLASQIRICINSWEPHFLITPLLAISGLHNCLQDTFWTHMVRVPGARYHHLDGMFGDNQAAEFRGRHLLIMAMLKADPLLELTYCKWEECLNRWGAVLAKWWWDGFRVENQWDVADVSGCC